METTPDWALIGGIAIGLVGIAAAVFYGRRSRRVKQPVYIVKSNNLVENLESKVDGVAITFKGNPVRTLTVSKIAFWNAGNETIDASDISDNDPLRIFVTDGEILEASVVSVTSPAVDLKLGDIGSPQTLHVGFDFLDHKQGGVFQVIHTGLGSENVRVDGSVRGAGIPRKRRRARVVYLLQALAVWVGIAIMAGYLARWALIAVGMSSESSSTLGLLAGYLAFFGVMGLGQRLLDRLVYWDVPPAILGSDRAYQQRDIERVNRPWQIRWLAKRLNEELPNREMSTSSPASEARRRQPFGGWARRLVADAPLSRHNVWSLPSTSL
jgi:hypothetical protein